MGDDILFFFLNDTATPEIYTLSLPDALPISGYVDFLLARAIEDLDDRLGAVLREFPQALDIGTPTPAAAELLRRRGQDRKSTRLNSSHANISYAVFCLKKKTRRTSR